MAALDITIHSDSPPSRARCRHFGICGGCRLQDVPYERQVCDKTAGLRHLLASVLPDDLLSTLDVHPSPAVWEYRNRMEFTFSTRQGRLVLGLHRRGEYWHVLDLEECFLCPPPFLDLVRETRRFAMESGLPAYDKNEHTGFWRYLLVRGSRASGRVLAEVMTAGEDAGTIESLAEHLRAACPQLAGMYWGRVPGLADAAVPDHTEHLVGDPFIVEKLAGLEIPVGPMTFMQPNVAVAELLYRDLADTLHLKGVEEVVDLYCGVGAIGASLARRARKVLGVEREPVNVGMGREMLRRNGLSNMRIVESEVQSLPDGAESIDQPDVIVVDPPRVGLNKRVLKHLHSWNPNRIAYVSCNPKVLKDDLRRFCESGRYRLRIISGYDMFPHTPHMEVLSILDRVS